MLGLIFSIILGVITFALYIKYFWYKRIRDDNLSKPALLMKNDWDKVFKNFAKSLTYKTVSYDVGNLNELQIKELIIYLEKAFPLVHSCPWIERRVVEDLSLLYICDPRKSVKHDAGKSGFRKAWMIIAHLDVVPVDEKDINLWKYDPFGGRIDPESSNVSKSPNDEGIYGTPKDWFARYIYGRGALDVKNVVFATLEALESLLKNQSKGGLEFDLKDSAPLYLVFGCDEEVGGLNGARLIAQELSQDLNFTDESEKPISFIIDEGTSIYTDIPVIPNLDKTPRNVACISVSEKSTVKFNLSTQLGIREEAKKDTHEPPDPDKAVSVFHSSIPPTQTALTKLAQAAINISSHKFPVALNVNTRDNSVNLLSIICDTLAPYLSNPINSVLLSNLNPLRSCAINSIFTKNPILNSCLRTTSCVTIFKSGIKDNVIPNRAEASLNQRIHPTQTVDQVESTNKSVMNDADVKSQLLYNGPNIPISSVDCEAYKLLTKHIKRGFGSETLILPIIFPASTDSKHFIHMADDIYRFTPVTLKIDDLNRYHGINERISLASYARCVDFYYNIILDKFGISSN